MKLVTYQHEGQVRTGAKLNGQIVDLNRAYKVALYHGGNHDELAVADARVPPNMIALLNGGDAAMRAAQLAVSFIEEQLATNQGETGGPGIVAMAQYVQAQIGAFGKALKLGSQGILYAAGDVALLPPVLRPGKVVCLGLNYRAHATETGVEVPQYPVLFHKVVTSLVGDGQPVVIPRISEMLDYECELAIIMGKRGKYIPEDEALSYAAGYTCANDISARDLQSRTSQWTTGKMVDASCPLGPALVTRDEITDPNTLNIKTVLNGEVMQDANTNDMIFSVPQIISYISQIATLEPGDVILTGTPSGIGSFRKPPVFLKDGDTVTIEIEKLGSLTNPVIAEA